MEEVVKIMDKEKGGKCKTFLDRIIKDHLLKKSDIHTHLTPYIPYLFHFPAGRGRG